MYSFNHLLFGWKQTNATNLWLLLYVSTHILLITNFDRKNIAKYHNTSESIDSQKPKKMIISISKLCCWNLCMIVFFCLIFIRCLILPNQFFKPQNFKFRCHFLVGLFYESKFSSSALAYRKAPTKVRRLRLLLLGGGRLLHNIHHHSRVASTSQHSPPF